MTEYAAIKEKRNILREQYGGMMTLTDLSREIGMTHENAKIWAEENGLGHRLGKRIRYESDELAKIIVKTRGMC